MSLLWTRQENFKIWQITRNKGMARYILVNWVIKWGLNTAVSWLLVMKVFDDEFNILDHLLDSAEFSLAPGGAPGGRARSNLGAGKA